MKISQICDRVLEYSFYALFFLVPLILTPLNYELFEYNKMVAVYGLTVIIVGAWLIKMVVTRQLIIRRTPLDIPITIYLITQLLSTFFSIDRHVSLFGYYSRFHGGFLSTISYILLYYALVSNINRDQVIKFLKISLLSGLVVSLYGILEHFGIDKDIWVQDVQNRVFSTLGQPNWLAAYLAILIPVAMALPLNETWNMKHGTWRNFTFYFLLFTFYLCLLYTKSRSGFAAFWIVNIMFWGGLFLLDKMSQLRFFVFKNFLIVNSLFLILTFISGAPFAQINRFTAQELFKPKILSPSPYPLSPSPTGPALEVGGTESGEIRRIVWKGALEIAKHYPLFGSGVETFAFSYYQFRPKEHNLVSEWDFLYNKAHNEYLNYAATTGFIGLGAYLLLIAIFGWWFIRIYSNYVLIYPNIRMNSKKIRENSEIKPTFKNEDFGFITLGLFTGWTSILITNFFGFSVVPVALYFYLIPAMSIVLITSPTQGVKGTTPLRCDRGYTLGIFQGLTLVTILFTIFYLLFTIAKLWYADTRFNRAYQLARAGYYKEAYEPYHQAINLNPGEPLYRDEFAYTAAVLAVAAFEQKEATLSAQLVNEALAQSKIALATSPNNVNFWKTRTKIFYTLSTIDEKYNEEALESLLAAQKLAPTDAKIAYNLGLLYGRVGNSQMAIKTLQETVKLKPNYQDARYALALYYNETGRRPEAIAQLEYILAHIATDAGEAIEKLREWQ
jgi:tetratricopeptide (TPR) repeat protein